MSQAIKQTALFVRDLLTYDEQLIRIGRLNYELDDTSIAYITIDAISGGRRLARGEKYNGTTEVMTHQQQWIQPVIINFYGDNAWAAASTFAVLIGSEQSRQLQDSLGIGVYQVGGLTDVKLLTGQQYGERVEIELNIHYSISANIDTLRIDTAILSVITEQGQELAP